MIKVAMLSFWHVHARDYAKQATEHPDTEITAVWDERPERGRKEAEARGVRFFESLDELLAQQDIDGVIVDTPTNMHRDVMVAAARAGKHIFTEKVVATTLKECNEILAAVEEAGVKLTVSLPRLNAGYTEAVQDVIRQGLLGDLTLVRTRLSHNGAIPSERGSLGWSPCALLRRRAVRWRRHDRPGPPSDVLGPAVPGVAGERLGELRIRHGQRGGGQRRVRPAL
ncbi:Gfo/Idh/MocA family oxidoreductase [Paenibacillus sp. P26]|nr:Gfo/Idh/MocA family oxidoreductase [Paenibacillus sp. P26]